MRVSRRTSIDLVDMLDVRLVEEKLKGQYDNIYITFTTIENQADAWQDQGDCFLHIPLSAAAMINGENIDFGDIIIKHLPLLNGVDYQELIAYVKGRMQANYAQ